MERRKMKKVGNKQYVPVLTCVHCNKIIDMLIFLKA